MLRRVAQDRAALVREGTPQGTFPSRRVGLTHDESVPFAILVVASLSPQEAMIQTAGVGVPTGDCVGIVVAGRCGTPTARCARSRNVERSNCAELVAQEAVSHIIR